MKRAVVLLSGGLDSATCLAVAKRDGFTPTALIVMYGQRHSIEKESALRVAQSMGVDDVREVSVDLRAIGGSALTANIPVPKHTRVEELTPNVPVTYVPARNSVFLSIALGLAETIQSNDIYIGVNAIDYSGYPDCRPEFIRAFEQMAQLATKSGTEKNSLTIRTPLANLTKAEIIQLGVSLNVDYALTHSCYDPVGTKACGHCDSCLLRKKGFEEAQVPDPTVYSTS